MCRMNAASKKWVVKMPGQPDQTYDFLSLKNALKSGKITSNTILVDVESGWSFKASQVPDLIPKFPLPQVIISIITIFFLLVYLIARLAALGGDAFALSIHLIFCPDWPSSNHCGSYVGPLPGTILIAAGFFLSLFNFIFLLRRELLTSRLLSSLSFACIFVVASLPPYSDFFWLELLPRVFLIFLPLLAMLSILLRREKIDFSCG